MRTQKKGVGDLRAAVAFSHAQLSSSTCDVTHVIKLTRLSSRKVFQAREFKGQALVRKGGEPGNEARYLAGHRLQGSREYSSQIGNHSGIWAPLEDGLAWWTPDRK